MNQPVNGPADTCPSCPSRERRAAACAHKRSSIRSAQRVRCGSTLTYFQNLLAGIWRSCRCRRALSSCARAGRSSRHQALKNAENRLMLIEFQCSCRDLAKSSLQESAELLRARKEEQQNNALNVFYMQLCALVQAQNTTDSIMVLLVQKART